MLHIKKKETKDEMKDDTKDETKDIFTIFL